MAGKRPLAGQWLYLSLFRHLKRVVYLDSEISNRALQLRVPQQQLDSAQVLCPTIDERSLCSTHGVCAIRGVIESDRCNPAMDKPGVLARRQVRGVVNATREEEIRGAQARLSHPNFDALPSLFSYLKLDRSLRFLLQNRRPASDTLAMADIPHT